MARGSGVNENLNLRDVSGDISTLLLALTDAGRPAAYQGGLECLWCRRSDV